MRLFPLHLLLTVALAHYSLAVYASRWITHLGDTLGWLSLGQRSDRHGQTVFPDLYEASVTELQVRVYLFDWRDNYGLNSTSGRS